MTLQEVINKIFSLGFHWDTNMNGFFDLTYDRRLDGGFRYTDNHGWCFYNEDYENYIPVKEIEGISGNRESGITLFSTKGLIFNINVEMWPPD